MVRRAVLSAFILAGLAGCGGGGGGGDGGGDGRPSSKLFVADSGNRAIGSLINPNPAPGTAVVDRIVFGPNTGLGTMPSPSVSNVPSIALDAGADRLFVATQGNVLSFDNIGFADGDVRWTRMATSIVNRGGQNFAVNFFALFLDTQNNRLYVGEPIGHVHVFTGAATLSGSVTPSRTVSPNIGSQIDFTFGVAVDVARDILYYGAVSGTSRIVVFEDQSGVSGSVAPDRTLTFANAVGSFFLDAVNNRLYVAQATGPILVFDGASTLTTTTSPTRTITLGTTQKYIFVDTANNRLYAVSDNQVLIVNNASTANDPGVPATLISVQTTGSLFSAVAVKP